MFNKGEHVWWNGELVWWCMLNLCYDVYMCNLCCFLVCGELVCDGGVWWTMRVGLDVWWTCMMMMCGELVNLCDDGVWWAMCAGFNVWWTCMMMMCGELVWWCVLNLCYDAYMCNLWWFWCVFICLYVSLVVCWENIDKNCLKVVKISLS